MTDEVDAEPTADSEDPSQGAEDAAGSSSAAEAADTSGSAEDGADEPGTEAGTDESETEAGTDESETEAGTDESETEAEDPDAAESEESLVERVAAHDEDLAEEVRAELETAEADIEELESKLKRKQADFQNFKKRQQQKVADQVARATEDLVEQLLPVRDNLARALDQDADADIREGVEGTLRELDRVLEDEGVSAITPDRGDEPDPERHEVMMRVESDQPEGTIEELYRPGYEMEDRVVRTAQVTVSDGE